MGRGPSPAHRDPFTGHRPDHQRFAGLGAAVVSAVAAAGGTLVVLDVRALADPSGEHVLVDLADGRAAEEAIRRVAERAGGCLDTRRGGRPGTERRRWPRLLVPGALVLRPPLCPDRFAAAAAGLAAAGLPVLVSGTEAEAGLVTEVVEGAAHPGVRALPVAPLPIFAALVERATVAITNNAGGMHLTDALRTPVAVTYAGTERLGDMAPRSVPAVLLRHDVPCSPSRQFAALPAGMSRRPTPAAGRRRARTHVHGGCRDQDGAAVPQQRIDDLALSAELAAAAPGSSWWATRSSTGGSPDHPAGCLVRRRCRWSRW